MNSYVGDLPNSGWRVFNTTHDGLVAIVTSGRPVQPLPNPMWSWYFPVRKLEGADGRAMSVHCTTGASCLPLLWLACDERGGASVWEEGDSDSSIAV